MLYFDEAGNSGDNLLDKDQPLYLLLSHDFTATETDDILAPLLKESQAQELHFKTVKKYHKQRQALIQCFKNPLIREGRAHYYVAHKEFMIVIHIVDKLIEHVLYEAGIDIYKGGENLATANILYIMGKRIWDRQLFEEMCARFVKWTRSALTEDGNSFYAAVTELFATLGHERDKTLLAPVLYSQRYMEDIADSFEKYGTDATLSCLVEHCHYWSKIYTEPFEITFDDSKQIAHWRGMIDFLNSLPSTEVGYGSRKHRYPLQIKDLSTGESKTNRQLQLADLLASYISHYFQCQLKGIKDELADEMHNTGIADLIGNQMWPSNQVTPSALDMEDQSGQNPLDFIADQARRRADEYEKVSPPKRREVRK